MNIFSLHKTQDFQEIIYPCDCIGAIAMMPEKNPINVFFSPCLGQ